MAISKVVVSANVTVIIIYVLLFLPQPLVAIKITIGVEFEWFSANSNIFLWFPLLVVILSKNVDFLKV